VWNDTPFESHLSERLESELGHARAQPLYASYVTARTKLVDNIFREIPAVEPDLSDHGPDHIANVQNNAISLLSADHCDHSLSAMELYLLAVLILFHDVGNLFGRKDHHKHIAEIFDWARGTDASVRHEKTLVMRAAAAHTGVASDGSNDTLKELEETNYLNHKPVRLCSLAAILRFADELAEGPQRTSEYRRRMKMYAVESRIFHEYASITNVWADRLNQRIVITYEVEVAPDGRGLTSSRRKELKALLQFAFERVQKLEQERRYTRFYSPALTPFIATHISRNFHLDGQLLPIDLPTIELNDRVIPGEPPRPLSQVNSRWETDRVVGDVVARAAQQTKEATVTRATSTLGPPTRLEQAHAVLTSAQDALVRLFSRKK
jgi:hypothetical protein